MHRTRKGEEMVQDMVVWKSHQLVSTSLDDERRWGGLGGPSQRGAFEGSERGSI